GLVAVEALADVVRPLLDRLGGRHLLERAHRREVAYLRELVGGGRADALGRRVGRDELGVGGLELDELVEGAVVGGVVDRRVVEHVILVEPAVEQRPQLGGALGGGGDARGHPAAPRARRRRRRRPRGGREGGSSPR